MDVFTGFWRAFVKRNFVICELCRSGLKFGVGGGGGWGVKIVYRMRFSLKNHLDSLITHREKSKVPSLKIKFGPQLGKPVLNAGVLLPNSF